MRHLTFPLAGAALLLAAAACAQEPQKLTIPLTDPAKPVTLRVGMQAGSITVKTHTGKDVVIDVQNRGARREQPKTGMRRIGPTGGEVRAEELDNTVRVSVSHASVPTDLVILTPPNASLKLTTMNDGEIAVDGVSGEIDANNMNGPVTLNNVSGSVIAHSMNGKIKVTMDRVDARKPMAFSTMNGEVDVTLPADLKANVKMKSDNGEILSDFEIVQTPVAQTEGGKRDASGRYRVAISRHFQGTINGGGQQIEFTTMNGTIHIRRKAR